MGNAASDEVEVEEETMPKAVFNCKPYLPRIEAALHDKKQVKSQLELCFNTYAKDGRLDFAGAKKVFRDSGVKILGLDFAPYLADEGEFQRFDFDGDGAWELSETVKCFRKNLAYLRDTHDASFLAQNVPFMTPEEAGYTVVKVLGEGGQGSAKLADSAKGQVCLKVYDRSNENACGITELLAEMRTMQSLEKCPYIMNVIEIFQDDDKLYCVNEVLTGKDFCSIRENAKKQDIDITEDYWKPVFTQCLMGLGYMHRCGLIHCDIKEDNIMLKDKDFAHPHAVIIDFGLCVAAAGDTEAGGTEGYMPPEVLSTGVWFPRGDIFSLGVVFFQLLTEDDRGTLGGCFSVNTGGMFSNDDTRTTSPFWHVIDDNYPDCKVWLKKMLAKKRLDRSTAVKVLEEEWFLEAGAELGVGRKVW